MGRVAASTASRSTRKLAFRVGAPVLVALVLLSAACSDEGGVPGPVPSSEVARPALGVWRSFAIAGDEIEHYTTLQFMTRTASIVVTGSIEDVQPGRVFGEPGDLVQYVRGTLRVRDVLAGDGAGSGDALKLELGPLDAGIDIEKRYEPLVGDGGVFFLRRIGEAIPAFGIPREPAEEALGFYGPVSSQGVFLNDRGRVALAFWADEGFPNSFADFPYQDFVARVRSYAPQVST